MKAIVSTRWQWIHDGRRGGNFTTVEAGRMEKCKSTNMYKMFMVNFMVVGGKLRFQTREKYFQIPVIASVNLSIKELYAPRIKSPTLITKNSITTQFIKIPNLTPTIFFFNSNLHMDLESTTSPST
ncbi:hypothetical protein ACB098_03G090000 [Castanea mollissima]